MNPLFKPTPPMSNHAKEEIYRLHRSDTTKWTPRQLGTKYNISIKRVEAILRLKHLEKEMVASGFVAQENFTRGMEQLMGVKNERSAAIVEPLTDILPQVGSPKFEAVSEDKTFTAEDAANVLKRRPLAEIKANLLEQERKNPFKLVDSVKGVAVKEEAVTKPVSKNSAEGNARFKFSFVDTSKKVRARGRTFFFVGGRSKGGLHGPSHFSSGNLFGKTSLTNDHFLANIIDQFDQRKGWHFASGSAIMSETYTTL